MLRRTLLLTLTCIGFAAAQSTSPSDAKPGQPVAAARAKQERGDPVRGITISTPGIGREWGDPKVMASTVAEIDALGANWLTVHPYASIRNDGTVRFRGSADGVPPAMVTEPIRQAHARGLKVLIKPHLAYWGSGFSWRGEITFEKPEQWQRFWSGYRKWIVALAKASKDADGFAIGTELDKTLGHPEEWRRIIREVRAQTAASLTYAANWTDYQRVPFWGELDVIGVQAYFPLTAQPTQKRRDLDAGWLRQMREISVFAKSLDRYVIFTELGYNRSFKAPVEPWEYRMDGEDASQVQEACLRSALAAVRAEPRVIGAFLWKWFPVTRRRDHNFKLQTPGMKRVIADSWLR